MAIEVVGPARTVQGSVLLPGDKSISHRYALLGGLAEGLTRLDNFSTGADPASSLACMRALGAEVRQEGTSVEITGVGGAFRQPEGSLDCGNSGSTMRMLAGMLAAQPGREFVLVGDQSLSVRPMERVRGPLALMDARVGLTDGHAPMRIEGRQLRGIDFASPIASAQVKTAVLFAGLQASGETSVLEAVRTRDHSEQALRAFGVSVEKSAGRLRIVGGQSLRGIQASVPGDLSSAAFFLAASLLFPDSNLVLDGLGLNPTRSMLLDVMGLLGAKIKVLSVEEQHGELRGTLQVNTEEARSRGPLVLEGALTAGLIDELPVLAAIAPYTAGGLVIRDAAELRVKESDRIDLVARNLRAMGAELTEKQDGLEIAGGQRLHGARIQTGGDHRIAMAFAVAALRAEGENEIEGAEAAGVSFPEFFTLLRGVCPA